MMRRFQTTALAACLGLAGIACQAAEFTLLIYESPGELMKRSSPAEGAAYWGAYNEFAAAMAQAGVLRGGSALRQQGSVLVRGNGGSAQAVAGAQLGGYFVIGVPDTAAARQWAQRVPASAVGVELVAHQPNPSMAGAPVAPAR